MRTEELALVVAMKDDIADPLVDMFRFIDIDTLRAATRRDAEKMLNEQPITIVVLAVNGDGAGEEMLRPQEDDLQLKREQIAAKFIKKHDAPTLVRKAMEKAQRFDDEVFQQHADFIERWKTAILQLYTNGQGACRRYEEVAQALNEAAGIRISKEETGKLVRQFNRWDEHYEARLKATGNFGPGNPGC